MQGRARLGAALRTTRCLLRLIRSSSLVCGALGCGAGTGLRQQAQRLRHLQAPPAVAVLRWVEQDWVAAAAGCKQQGRDTVHTLRVMALAAARSRAADAAVLHRRANSPTDFPTHRGRGCQERRLGTARPAGGRRAGPACRAPAWWRRARTAAAARPGGHRSRCAPARSWQSAPAAPCEGRAAMQGCCHTAVAALPPPPRCCTAAAAVRGPAEAAVPAGLAESSLP